MRRLRRGDGEAPTSSGQFEPRRQEQRPVDRDESHPRMGSLVVQSDMGSGGSWTACGGCEGSQGTSLTLEKNEHHPSPIFSGPPISLLLPGGITPVVFFSVETDFSAGEFKIHLLSVFYRIL